MDMNKINLRDIQETPLIFSDIAKEASEFIRPKGEKDPRSGKVFYKNKDKDANKSTQLRKFYDELSMWDDKIHRITDKAQRQAEYEKSAPFIHMLKAKAAYAKGRDHVNGDFLKLFNHLIGQIDSPETLRHAKLFFEAMIGFRKAAE